MSTVVDAFVNALAARGWAIDRAPPATRVALGESVRARYTELDAQHAAFLQAVRRCIDPDRVTWFVCADDYAETSSWPIRWNEWELHALEVAAGRAKLVATIERFWSTHVPVVGTLKSEYSYLALRVAGPDRGAIYYGNDPEVVGADKVADSFNALLEATCRRVTARSGGPAWMDRFF